MRISKVLATLCLVVCLYSAGARAEESKDDGSALDCIFEENAGSCFRKRFAREIDNIETEVTGKKSEVPMSAVIEETSELVADVLSDIQGVEEEVAEESEVHEESRGMEEARKKKFGKKKKKVLEKLYTVAMLMKAKISLFLQIISTHLQVKFFAIALLSLAINVARFWIDLKKVHSPSKVVYYEHAQHQHHYDHEDDHHGYWGRSSNASPEDLAYNAYAPRQ